MFAVELKPHALPEPQQTSQQTPPQDAVEEICPEAAGSVPSDNKLHHDDPQGMIVPAASVVPIPPDGTFDQHQHNMYSIMLYMLQRLDQTAQPGQPVQPVHITNHIHPQPNSWMFVVCICVFGLACAAIACAVMGMGADIWANGRTTALCSKGLRWMAENFWACCMAAIHLLVFCETKHAMGSIATLWYPHVFFLAGSHTLYQLGIKTDLIQDLHAKTEKSVRKWGQDQFEQVRDHFNAIKEFPTTLGRSLYDLFDEASLELFEEDCPRIDLHPWEQHLQHLLAPFAMVLCLVVFVIFMDYRETLDDNVGYYIMGIRFLRMLLQLVGVLAQAYVYQVVTEEGIDVLWSRICQLVLSMYAKLLCVPHLALLCLIVLCCVVCLPLDRQARVRGNLFSGKLFLMLFLILLPGGFADGSPKRFNYDAFEADLQEVAQVAIATHQHTTIIDDSDAKLHFACHFIGLVVLCTALLFGTASDTGFKSAVNRQFWIHLSQMLLILTVYYQFRKMVEMAIGEEALKLALIKLGLWSFFQQAWLFAAKSAFWLVWCSTLMQFSLVSIVSALSQFVSDLRHLVSDLRQLVSRDAKPIVLLTPSHDAK